jgi:ubiquinone/menaquinone biosynthesis C-methylase UbiE
MEKGSLTLRIKDFLATVEESDPRLSTYSAKLFHTPRYREVTTLVKQHTGEIGILLDVGCGRGLYRDWLLRSGVKVGLYVGGDIDPSRLRQVRGERIVHDAQHLPLRDGSADCVLCSEVLEHLEKPLTALSEQLRVSRNWVVLSFPEEELKNAIGFRYPEHISQPRLDELEALAKNKSFRLVANRTLRFAVPPSVLDRLFRFTLSRLRLFSAGLRVLTALLGAMCLIEDHVVLFQKKPTSSGR